MKVEVRPIPKEKWHGKTGKEAFARTQVIMPLYDASIGGYATGLNYDKKEDEEYQKFFTNERLDNMYDPENPHPFWESERFQIKLPNNTKFFNTDNKLEALQVKVLKASRFVANSMSEYEQGLYPDATHVIFDEEEQMEIKSKKAEIKFKAVEVALGLSTEEKVNLVQILSDKSVRNQSSNFITVEIDNAINNDPQGFLKYATMDKEEMYLRAMIMEAVYKGILRKEQGGSIFYMDEKMGFDLESAIEYFNDPDNQQLKIKVLEQLNK